LLALALLLTFLFCTYVFFFFFHRNEKKFLLSELQVKRFPTWHERQAAFVSSVKEFVVKLKPDFESVEIKFVRSLRVDPKLYLEVECGNPFQYVLLVFFVLILASLLVCLISLQCFILRSQSVRSHWGTLMRSGAAKRDHPNILIHNVVTLGTRVRITLLRVCIYK
jgi:hypothetical protein